MHGKCRHFSGLQAEKSRRQRAIGVLYASAGSKKAHMTKNAGFYIVSLVGKVLFNANLHSYRTKACGKWRDDHERD